MSTSNISRALARTEAQRTEARQLIHHTWAELTGCVGWAHEEEEGCLPMPQLHSPHTPTGYQTYIGELADNLFADGRNISQAWQRAAERCPHLDESRVTEIHELVVAWYRVVCAADRTHRGVAQVGGGLPEAVRRFHQLADVFRGGDDGNRCRCGARNDDGEGYDGDCGNCADRKEAGRG